MTRICVIDFETTGMEDHDCVVEIGCTMIENGEIIDCGSSLCDPEIPIPPQASAIHHITDAMVEGEASASECLRFLFGGAPDGTIFAAHNVAFDSRFGGPHGGNTRPWLCTLKAARRIWPDAPGHANQVLRYWLGLDLDPVRCEPVHRAGPDAFVTANILLRLMEHASVEDMVRWTSEPSLLTKMPFGKHRGLPFRDLPPDYLAWITRQSDIDPDVKFTARAVLEGGNV